MLSNINKVLVAKTDREDNNAWLPLWMHSKDTTGIIDYLLTEFVSDSFSQSIELEKGQLLQIGRFLAFNHDIGKATDLFQGKIIIDKPILNTRLEHYGLKIAEEQKQEPEKTPHALAGEVILRHFNVPESVACVVGAHHGMPSSLVNMSKIGMSVRDQSLDLAGKDACCQLNYYGNLANKQQWQDMWKNWLGVSLVESGYKSVKDLPKLSKMAQILLSGLIIMADWIASNTKLFPLLELDDLGDKDVYPSRVEKAWEQLNFPPSWNPVQDSYSAMRFRQQFNFNANSVQATVLQAVSESNSPGIYILEAPMGCGKTEAALAASEILASKYNKTGVFFGLPTQATANGIYARFKKWCESQSEDENHSIKLVYKDSEMYEPFRKIQSNIPMKASEESVGGLLVHNWFSGKKQSCLVSFAVGTVDQMLMAALKRKHVMLLHLGLSEKVVIIDECHAYDAYMNQYLERSLQWLGMYGVPVVLLSATLPANRRMELIKAYQNERGIDNKLADSKSYPLLTWTNGKKINQRIIPYDGESKEVIITEIPECDIVNAVQKAIANKGCVGVIANTVTRAQELAQLLREKTNGEVILYHARYIMPDRADKEAEILSRVGKESKPTQRKKLIVVGTQVLEQSLDIDFDLLITEWCPMDLLLQRIGRLHRHSFRTRSTELENAQCMIIQPKDEDFDKGSEYIYGKWLLIQTREKLCSRITIPEDISPLVQSVYLSDEPEEDELLRLYNDNARKLQDKREKAKAFLLGKAKREGNIHGMLEDSVTDKEVEAEASVRDGDVSIEVLVMMRSKDGQICFLPWQNNGQAVPSNFCPDEETCMKIARQKLRLPGAICYNAKSTIRALEEQCLNIACAWQNSHWLCGELILVLDENLNAQINNFRLTYSKENGLSHKKEVYNNGQGV